MADSVSGNSPMEKLWKQLSVLIAGAGSIGKRHARVLQALGIEDIRVCDPRLEARQEMAAQVPLARQYDSYQAGLLDKPDTVFICTPPWMHVPMAIAAVEAGSHVMCEKPLSDSDQGIDRLIALSEQRRKKVMVALCFRYHAGVIKACEYLQSGRVGRVVSLRSLMGEHLPHARPDYRDLHSARHMGAFDLMHDLDLVLWLADRTVKKVLCVAGNYSDINIEAVDLVEILIDFDGPCAATVHLDFFQQPRRRQLELIGTEGAIIVEFASWDICTVSVYQANKGFWEHEQINTDRDDMFQAENREFLQAVVDDRQVSCTIEEGRKALAVVLECV